MSKVENGGKLPIAIIEEYEPLGKATKSLLEAEGYEPNLWDRKQEIDNYIQEITDAGIRIVLVAEFLQRWFPDNPTGEEVVTKIKEQSSDIIVIGRGMRRPVPGAHHQAFKEESPQLLLDILKEIGTNLLEKRGQGQP